MKTRRLTRFSSGFQSRCRSPSRSMCTPWKTKRFGSSLKARMPFARKIEAPSFAHNLVAKDEFFRIDITLDRQSDGLHVFVVIML